MAYDKAIDSVQLDADLTTVADAIRAKGKTTDQLVFPAGFKTAIENIKGGSLKILKEIYQPSGILTTDLDFKLPNDIDYKITEFIFIMRSYPSANSNDGFTFISTWNPDTAAFSVPELIGGDKYQFTTGQPKLTISTRGRIYISFYENQYSYDDKYRQTFGMFIYNG